MDAVVVEGFSFTYEGQAYPVLDGVSLRIPEGAFAVICGSTGSGKTTLLRCMTEALAPLGESAGSVRVPGAALPDSLGVGMVMQDPDSQMVCDSVLHELAFGLENMGMEPDAMRRRVAEIATVFGIGQLMDARTAELSGGQKQLVNLAAAIAMRPKVLLLDEPTAQLDPVAARQLLEILRMANEQLGITIVVATHSPELFAGMASCVFELDEGRVHEMPLASLRFAQEGEAAFGGASANDAKDATTHGRPPKEAHLPVATVRDAWFSYARNESWVLKGLTFQALAGRVTCIVGGNGSGKTTLLKLLAGILAPQRGKVRNEARSTQAYLPQDPRLLLTADTVAEELALAKGIDDGLGLLDAFDPCAYGLSPLDLSGGQQQLLALARLLAANPKLLFLDEPVKGLDAESELRLALLLRRIADEGAAVVIATHDLAFASRTADEIAMLFDGQIVSQDAPEAFFADAVYWKPMANAFTVAWDAKCAAAEDGEHE